MLIVQIQKLLQSAEGEILLDVALALEKGQTLAVYGKSGVGKTTLLRLIAGLEIAQKGSISWSDERWLDTEKGICIAPQQRATAMVFQDFALFPNMTVAQNVAFGQKTKDSTECAQILRDLGLENLSQRLPQQLSGGQKQRVALARAVARKPQLLLLDEPLSALDTETRLEFQAKLKALKVQQAMTSILVSHDIAEIFQLADQVIVIEEGKVKAHGSPAEVFLQTEPSGFVWLAQVVHWHDGQVSLQMDGKIQQFPYPSGDLISGSIVQLRILPSGIEILPIPFM